MTAQSHEAMVKVCAAAPKLGVTERTVRRRCAAGEIPARKLGRIWLLYPDWLAEFTTRPAVQEVA